MYYSIGEEAEYKLILRKEKTKRFFTAVETYHCGAILKKLETQSALFPSALSTHRQHRFFDAYMRRALMCLRAIMYAKSLEILERQYRLFSHAINQLNAIISEELTFEEERQSHIASVASCAQAQSNAHKAVLDLENRRRLHLLCEQRQEFECYKMWQLNMQIKRHIDTVSDHRRIYLHKQVNRRRFGLDMALATGEFVLSGVSLAIGLIFPMLLIPAVVVSTVSCVIGLVSLGRSIHMYRKDEKRYQLSRIDREFLRNRSEKHPYYARASMFLGHQRKRESVFDHRSSKGLLMGSALGGALGVAAIITSIPALAVPPLIPVALSLIALTLSACLITVACVQFARSWRANKRLDQTFKQKLKSVPKPSLSQHKRPSRLCRICDVRKQRSQPKIKRSNSAALNKHEGCKPRRRLTVSAKARLDLSSSSMAWTDTQPECTDPMQARMTRL